MELDTAYLLPEEMPLFPIHRMASDYKVKRDMLSKYIKNVKWSSKGCVTEE